MSPNLRAQLLQWTGDLEALMNVRQVSAFFGNVSKMTIYRWVRNPAFGFPRPFKIGQKNFWIRRDVIAFRDMAVQATGASRREKNSVSSGERSPGGRLDASPCLPFAPVTH